MYVGLLWRRSLEKQLPWQQIPHACTPAVQYAQVVVSWCHTCITSHIQSVLCQVDVTMQVACNAAHANSKQTAAAFSN